MVTPDPSVQRSAPPRFFPAGTPTQRIGGPRRSRRSKLAAVGERQQRSQAQQRSPKYQRQSRLRASARARDASWSI